MASNNDDTNGAAIIFVFIVFMAIGGFLLAALYAIILGIISLFALFKPLKLGKHTFLPGEARAYLIRGFVGIALAPIVTAMVIAFFDVTIPADWLPWVALAGYTIGSLGVEYILQALNGDEDEPEDTFLRPAAVRNYVLPPQEKRPYEFASWDDEDVNQRK